MEEKISNGIFSENMYQIRTQKSCILLRRVFSKVVQRIVKFEILNFWPFLSLLCEHGTI